MQRRQGTVNQGSGRDLFIKFFGKPIEEYASFKKATETLRAKTVENYLKTLPFYFLFLEEDPDAVISQRKVDITSLEDTERYERKTVLYAKLLSEKGMSGYGVSTYIGRVQGFYANNGKRLALDLHRLKFSKARKRKKYSPSNEDVRKLYGKANSWLHRLIVALMYQNGASPKDASLLCCGDYPSEPWQYFERSRSKTGEVWRGISTPDVCECLKAYLNVRGNYCASDPLLVGREGPLGSVGLSQVVRELLLKTGLDSVEGFKPTSLRDAFEDALVDAEIYHKIKEALMAHNSGIETHYGGYNRMVEKLTEAMQKVYPLICLSDANKGKVGLSGFSVDEAERLKVILANFDKLMRMFDLLENDDLTHVKDPKIT